MARRAGYVFAGTVIAIEHIPAGESSVGYTRITFHVDSAVAGVRRGQTVTIREWAGLWDSGERYRTGERVFLFLYPNSRLGLTSPVSGALGRFAIDNNGNVSLTPKPVGPILSNLANGKPSTKQRVTAHDFANAMRRARE